MTSKTQQNGVVIHTDGGCSPNPGVGAWAAVLQYGKHNKELSGGELRTTNNRMELTAAIMALEQLKRPCNVTLFTDSEYLRQGITSWLPAWKRRNWQRKSGALRNVDLWQRLDKVNSRHRVNWQWVRGHSGDPFNERCDALVQETIAELKASGKR